MIRRLCELLRDLPDIECSRHEAWMLISGGIENRKWGYVDLLGAVERRQRQSASRPYPKRESAGLANVPTDGEASSINPKALL